jgi:hypothetical protein
MTMKSASCISLPPAAVVATTRPRLDASAQWLALIHFSGQLEQLRDNFLV